MTKYLTLFSALLVFTLANLLYFGVKQTPEERPVAVQPSPQSTHKPAHMAQQPATHEHKQQKFLVWKETEYHEYKQVQRPKPAPRIRTEKQEAIIDGGIQYVKIPFKNKYIYVSTDYYKEDGIIKPVTLQEAQRIARKHGAVLPTKEMVDAIWKHADLKLAPQPLAPGPLMTTPAYFKKHQKMIEGQLKNRSYRLVAGHKKDIIQPQRQGRVTIYGWHRPNGLPIQPASNVHHDKYYDYSHGLRLVKLHS